MKTRSVPMNVLVQWMGHSSFAMINHVYDHPGDEDSHAEAAVRLGAARVA
jgi:hypothetical protein